MGLRTGLSGRRETVIEGRREDGVMDSRGSSGWRRKQRKERERASNAGVGNLYLFVVSVDVDQVE